MRLYSLVALVLSAVPVWAAPPTLDIPDEVKPVQGYARLTPKTDAVGVTYIAMSAVYPFPSDELKDSKRFILPVTGLPVGRYKFTAVAASATGEFTIKEFVVPVGDAPVPPPGPIDPIVPSKVTSFRVFLVYESGGTLSASQQGVMYGVDVENALTAACDGAAISFGWRRLDKDAVPGKLPTGLREAWTATKPNVTSVPCIVFQVNEKITIEPLPASVKEATDLIAKYRGK